ncbi:hypothetical protein FHG87_009717 [Trinorchestia longiramus]|nr:hypothetical protein FHG87_009717 [Trinorchestia longiramus]
MGNYLYSCCPPSAYPIIRYQAVAVRPREGSEEEALQLEIRTQHSGWQSAKSSSDDELLCIESEKEDEFVSAKLNEQKHIKNVFPDVSGGPNINGNFVESLDNSQTSVPFLVREKITKATQGEDFQSRTQTTQPHGITRFEKICFDINQSSESVSEATVTNNYHKRYGVSRQESPREQDVVENEEGSSETLVFDQLAQQINSPSTLPLKYSGHLMDEQRVQEITSAPLQFQLSQNIGGVHPHASHEHHFANLIVNPMADADTSNSMYGGAVRERVSLSPDVIIAESPPTASMELEWDKEPGMSHYKPEKPLPSASNTVDSSLGGLSSSRLRSLCSTPASLEWDFKGSTTSLQEVPLGADEEEAWGASDTEELLQEIEMLAARALQDDEGLQPPSHDR